MENHKVFECMLQKSILTRWVITEKSKDSKKIIKGCLVASSYEEDISDSKNQSSNL